MSVKVPYEKTPPRKLPDPIFLNPLGIGVGGGGGGDAGLLAPVGQITRVLYICVPCLGSNRLNSLNVAALAGLHGKLRTLHCADLLHHNDRNL